MEDSMEIGICFAIIGTLLFLYDMFGQILCFLTGLRANRGLCLLTGAFVYHALFQAEALPLMLLKQPLKMLSVLWLATVLLAAALWVCLRKKHKGETVSVFVKPAGSIWLLLLMGVAVALQVYYIVASEYLGWDTLYYVGTIGTSVATDTMYRYDGESGWYRVQVPMRYALSSFYLHAAVWCQIFPVRALYYAKIVQGGMLGLLSNLTMFEIGRFFFTGKRYQGKLTGRQVQNRAAGVVIAAVYLNFFYKTIFTPSDFLLNRGLEAKAYCSNLVLPLLFLLGMMMWRDCHSRKTRIILFCVLLGSVAISMSALITAPALVTLLMIPVLLRERTWKIVRFYILCMLPNLIYLALYYFL